MEPGTDWPQDKVSLKDLSETTNYLELLNTLSYKKRRWFYNQLKNIIYIKKTLGTVYVLTWLYLSKWLTFGDGIVQATAKEGRRVKNYICQTCGTQYAASEKHPSECGICEDERQYVGRDGQQWTTLEDMWKADYRNIVREVEPDLIGIGTAPSFGIGQRSLLVKTGHGNLLWDPISYLDSQTIKEVYRFGGIEAISASHPHFYSSMVEWSLAFDHAPIILPEADQPWIMRPDDRIRFFKDRTEILPQLVVVRCGGHFPGSSVLVWQGGADGRGVLLAGDTIMVAMDRKSVSFMYSYPNLIPLSAEKVRSILGTLNTLTFDRIYSAWWDRMILENAKKIIDVSAVRYINAISD
jgi:hypothetical protein